MTTATSAGARKNCNRSEHLLNRRNLLDGRDSERPLIGAYTPNVDTVLRQHEVGHGMHRLLAMILKDKHAPSSVIARAPLIASISAPSTSILSRAGYRRLGRKRFATSSIVMVSTSSRYALLPGCQSGRNDMP